ncbi:MAG: hypothetical protein WB660_13855 [Candidatus Sulfotelmatobacter sp.]
MLYLRRAHFTTDSRIEVFAPLHGERDIEWQFGVTIPLKGWILDADNFETRAHNWLDHNNIGEANVFWLITWSYAQIQGWELTLRSPNLWHRAQLHLAYANQFAQATSPISGGLIRPTTMPICPAYPPPGFGPVDHDQRNTLNLGFNASVSRLCRDERLLRVGVPQCLPRRTLSRRLSAGAHHV